MKNLAMISQPMNGLSEDQIEATRRHAREYLAGHGYQVASSFFQSPEGIVTPSTTAPGLAYLAAVLDVMSRCTTVFFCRGWKKARGCRIEHECAVQYGLQIIYEEDEENE